ncbi:MAG: SDR family NAD(P)-dependent oxidoreductase, partial [Pseudomonadota bacterium]
MTGKTALVVGAGGGIGSAMVRVLRDEGEYDNVIGFSRSESSPVALDITSEETIVAAADWISAEGLKPDLVFVATGILHNGTTGPEKSLRDLDGDWLTENYRINAIGPALIAKHFLPLMNRREPAIFAALSARVGSISDNRLGGWLVRISR